LSWQSIFLLGKPEQGTSSRNELGVATRTVEGARSRSAEKMTGAVAHARDLDPVMLA